MSEQGIKMSLQLKEIWQKVQNNTQCHVKYLKVLHKINKKKKTNAFYLELVNIIQCLVQQPKEADKCVNNVFICLSKFLSEIARMKEETNNKILFEQVIRNLLQHSDNSDNRVRFLYCNLLAMILTELGDTDVNDKLCKDISDKIYDRLHDVQVNCRIEAIHILYRLQDLHNRKCPIVGEMMELCLDANSKVKQEAVKYICVCPRTWNTIKNSTRDVHRNVRLVGFMKCGLIGPNYLRITDRVDLLKAGFHEVDEKVRKEFARLLQKWLIAYEGNYLKFVKALQLSTLPEDLFEYKFLCRDLIKFFVAACSIDDMIKNLNLNENKVIPMENLEISSSLLLNQLVNNLRHSEADKEEYLDHLLPDLTVFSEYIHNFYKLKMGNVLNKLEIRSFFFILENLLEIVEGYDLSDEFGRNALLNVIESILEAEFLEPKITTTLVRIGSKCDLTESFVDRMLKIIANKMESNSEKDDEDNELSCQCLDILRGVLELPTLKTLSQALIDFKSDFVEPLIPKAGVKMHWRIVKVMALYSLLDRAIASQYLKLLLIPLVTYNRCVDIDCNTIVEATHGIADIFVLYGSDFFSNDDSESDAMSEMRKLHEDNFDESKVATDITLIQIFKTLISMLESEMMEIRHAAVTAISRLNIQIEASDLSAIILRWFTAEFESDMYLINCLGGIMEKYRNVKQFKFATAEAMIHSLEMIKRSDNDSELRNINTDKLMSVYVHQFQVEDDVEMVRIIKFIVDKMSDNTYNSMLANLAKCFAFIQFETKNIELANELIKELSLVIKKRKKNPIVMKYVISFRELLKNLRSELENAEVSEENVEIRECVVRLERLNGI